MINWKNNQILWGKVERLKRFWYKSSTLYQLLEKEEEEEYLKAPLTGQTSWRINLKNLSWIVLFQEDVRAVGKSAPAKEKEQWKSCNPLLARDKETLLACRKLKRGYLYKVEAQINSYEFNISASDN